MNSGRGVSCLQRPPDEIRGDGFRILQSFCSYDLIVDISGVLATSTILFDEFNVSRSLWSGIQNVSGGKRRYEWFMEPWNKRGGQEKEWIRSETGKVKKVKQTSTHKLLMVHFDKMVFWLGSQSEEKFLMVGFAGLQIF